MEVIIRPDAATTVDLVARFIAKRVRRNPKIVMGPATERTMEQVYANLLNCPGSRKPHYIHGERFSSAIASQLQSGGR